MASLWVGFLDHKNSLLHCLARLFSRLAHSEFPDFTRHYTIDVISKTSGDVYTETSPSFLMEHLGSIPGAKAERIIQYER